MIYGSVITATGWTWDTVDRMTLSQLTALTRYWQKHPPTHVVIAGIARGLGGKTSKESQASSRRLHNPNVDQLKSLLATVGF